MLNFNAIISDLHDCWCVGVLRVKTDDTDNLHCHSQELTPVTGILSQETIIVFTNSNILIEIKALLLFFSPLWKDSQSHFPSPLSRTSCDVRDTHSVQIFMTLQ